MKCGKCNFEWNEKSCSHQLSVCPICGEKVIQNVQEKTYEINALSDALEEIIRIVGIDNCKNENLILNMLMDLAPHLKIEKIQFKLVFDTGIWSSMIQLTNEILKNQKQMIESSIKMLNDVGMQESISKNLIYDIAKSLHYDSELITGKFPFGKKINHIQYAQEEDINDIAEMGIQHYYFRNYKQAAIFLKQAAERGHAKAQYYFGDCYSKGHGVQQNDETAVNWYRKARKQFRKASDMGDVESQLYLGHCYHYGYGVHKNEKMAAGCYLKAAEQNHVEAQLYLGHCYLNGIGVQKDDEIAQKWYRKSVEQYQKYAEQGHTSAQIKLAYCYSFGFGVQKDIDKQVKLYQAAADNGNPSAQYALGRCYYRGHGVEENDRMAVNWYKKAAKQGHAEAQYELGDCYYNGYGVEENDEMAVKWYQKAAEQGHEEAQCALGDFYPSGVNEDIEMVQNLGERHMPVVLLVDNSDSMRGSPIAELNQGLVEFGQALHEDSLALGRVDVCVISFNSRVETELGFRLAADYQAPVLFASGGTNLNEAIEAGLDAIEARKKLYKSFGVPYYRPLLFLLTDGDPTDTHRESAAKERMHKAIKDGKVVYMPMGIGNANTAKLQEYYPHDVQSKVVLKANATNFKESFFWLSLS